MSRTHSKSGLITLITHSVPVVLLALGGWAGMYFMKAPKAIGKKPPVISAPQVETAPARLTSTPAIVTGMGLVIPAVEISLKSRVSGEITTLAPEFIPGGRIQKGAVVAQVDAADYEVALDKAQSAVEKALADLDLEQGNQTIAREEIRLLSQGDMDKIQETDLLLRKPQLAQAKAALHSAESDLKMARLNLNRTRIYSPFNAMIKSRSVNIGTHVSPQDTLAVLVGTDAYWIQASIPLDQVSALHAKADGPIPVTIRSQTGIFEGRLIQITGTLTENTRMAQVIVQVDDPLNLQPQGRAPLLLDDYVSVEITGQRLDNVIEVPRHAFRGNKAVWIFQDGKLAITQVTPVWKTQDYIYIKEGIQADQMIITSDLSTPVSGMKLSLSPRSQPQNASQSSGDPVNENG